MRPRLSLPGLVVRSCKPEEVRGVIDLWRAPRSRHGTDDPFELASTDRDALLVAELDGQFVGSLIAAWDGWRGTWHVGALPRSSGRSLTELRFRPAARMEP